MQIIFLDTPEAKLIISEILVKKPIVLAGSGISTLKSLTENDTENDICLPSGSEFTSGMFDYLFPPDFLGDNSHVTELLSKQWQNVVFENLLESCPDHPKLRRIIKRIFIKAKPNSIHKCIVDSFIKEDFSGLITTNYDLCFDDLFKYCEVERIVTKKDSKSINPLVEKLYFKIHGSVDDTDGETLVFALSHESLLDSGKQELLDKMIQNNSLLIVGYSGSDFEICPKLLEIPIETVFWNLRGEKYNIEYFMNKLSINAKKFLEKKDGYFLVGDIKDLFL